MPSLRPRRKLGKSEKLNFSGSALDHLVRAQRL